MSKNVITVVHPNGTKKVIVGKSSNDKPVKTRKLEETGRPRPETPFTGLTKERNAYKRGGKIKFKVS